MADPESYADTLEAQMLADYVASGVPLAKAMRVLGVPQSTTYDRIARDPAFAEMMEKARAAGYEVIAADCLDIADDSSQDVEDGRANKEFTARSKLRVETRLKLLSKWHPKRYGEKLEIEQKTANVSIPVGDDPVAATRAYEQLINGG